MIQVSIIIPVFNSAHLIGQTIDSVLKQNWTNWEMIIVDDGSSDAIQETVNPYALNDQRIKLLNQSNSGASAARNTAIKKAGYAWLLFLDADDWIREDYFEKMIPVLENDPSIDVVHCGWTRVMQDGTMGKAVFGGEESDQFYPLSYHCPFAIHSCIVRKRIVEEIGGFDVSFKTCVDWDLWQRVARTGARFHLVKEVMAFYRSTPGSLSSNGTQFCINGLQVITQAYAPDPRVPHPKKEHAHGLNADDLVIRKYCFVTWSAGLLIGAGKPASHLLDNLNGVCAENLDARFIAEILIDSVIVHAQKEKGAWHQHWFVIEDALRKFLEDLEKQSHSTGLAAKAIALIERHVIIKSANEITQLQIGKSFALLIDVESPVNDIGLPDDVERFFGIIRLQEKILGVIEIEAPNNLLSSPIIKDAIATKFSWQILHQFFLKTIYPSIKDKKSLSMEALANPEVHDKIGWEIFLQELWGKNDWDQHMFENPAFRIKEKAAVIKAARVIRVEVSEELPLVKVKAPELEIIYTIGGMEAGTAKCKKDWLGRVSPQMVRAAINLTGAYELCRVAVREVLIGQSFNEEEKLRELLRNKARERK
jgi:glycosyltransferase involved in cell wall biosynthesis